MDHDLRQFSGAKLLDTGRKAHRSGDKQLVRECLRELECRSSRAAAAAEQELRDLLKGRTRAAGRATRPNDADGPTEALALVKDADISYRREAMIERARRSIWLSSLTFPHSDLVPMLMKKARSNVFVGIVVANRTLKARHEAEVRGLTHAGARCTFLASTHSKALVIDEELVMLGSANAHGGHRDLCVLFRDRKLAGQIITYLNGLTDPAPIRGQSVYAASFSVLIS